MPLIEKTGTYVDGNGGWWFYKAGDMAPEGLKPAELAGEVKRHGAPENRAERPAETREEAQKGAASASKRAGR